MEKKNDRRTVSLAGKIQAGYFEVMKISAVFEATSTFVHPLLHLTENRTHIRQWNRARQTAYISDISNSVCTFTPDSLPNMNTIGGDSCCRQMNVQIFQEVLKIQNFINHIPAQVDRQQPVYLIDALGRQSPFHLEFIRSAEVCVTRFSILATVSNTCSGIDRFASGKFQQSRPSPQENWPRGICYSGLVEEAQYQYIQRLGHMVLPRTAG
jgi:hypothetical protein